MTQELITQVTESVLPEVFGIWFLIGAAFVFFMQAGFRDGRDRIYQSKKCRKHHYEEPDGFLYRNGCIYFPGIWNLFLGEDTLGGFIGIPNLGIFTDYAKFDWSNFVFNLVFCANSGNHRFRSHGRTYQILILLYLLRRDFRSGISDRSTLGMGWRLARSDGIS